MQECIKSLRRTNYIFRIANLYAMFSRTNLVPYVRMYGTDMYILGA